MSFTRALPLDELWDGDLVGLRVDGRAVVVIRRSDEVFAYQDRCAHLGVPLSQGRLDGDRLICSAHDYEYDVCSGAGVRPRGICLARYPVRIAEGAVWIDVTGVQALAAEGEVAMTASPTFANEGRVGPVLEVGDVAAAVVAALREVNPDLVVQDRGSYLRVLAPARCVLRRAAVERALGRPFRLPVDLELVMPSFVGDLAIRDDEAVWTRREVP